MGMFYKVNMIGVVNNVICISIFNIDMNVEFKFICYESILFF